MKQLIDQFVTDLAFGCHQTQTEVRRSDAADELRANPRAALPALVRYMEGRLPPTNPDDCIGPGLCMLMADLGRALCATVPQKLLVDDVPGWVAWGQEIEWELVWNE